MEINIVFTRKLCWLEKFSPQTQLKICLKKNIHKKISESFGRKISLQILQIISSASKKSSPSRLSLWWKTIFFLRNQRKFSLALVEPFEFPINQIESIEARLNNIYFQSAINFPMINLAGKKNSSKCSKPIFFIFKIFLPLLECFPFSENF